MPDTATASLPQRIRDLDGLLLAVATGDRVAFEALYRASASRLLGITLRVLRNRSEAEDALQEVFVTVWHKAAQFDPAKAGAGAWLAMIARNKAIDRLRAQAGSAQTATLDIDLAETLADGGSSPLQETERHSERARLDACLDTLEPRRRTLIHAAFFDGSSYEELAQRAGSPLGTVKSWIRRGLLQLRACLEQ